MDLRKLKFIIALSALTFVVFASTALAATVSFNTPADDTFFSSAPTISWTYSLGTNEEFYGTAVCVIDTGIGGVGGTGQYQYNEYNSTILSEVVGSKFMNGSTPLTLTSGHNYEWYVSLNYYDSGGALQHISLYTTRRSFIYDTVNPTVTGFTATGAVNGYYKGSIPVSGIGNDDSGKLSKMALYWRTAGGSTWNLSSSSPTNINAPYTYSTTWSPNYGAPDSRTYELKMEATDRVSHTSVETKITIPVDQAPPTTTCSNPPSSDWRTSDPSITLSATDTGGCGGVTTYYKINSSGTPTVWPSSTYTPSFPEGTSTFYYWSTDGLVNTETSNYFTIKKDSTRPTGPALTSPTNGSTLTSYSVTFQWGNADDGTNGSGIKEYDLYLGSTKLTTTTSLYYSTTLSSNGSYSWHVVARDNALLETQNPSIWSFTVAVDNDSPNITVTAPSSWQKDTGRVTATMSDYGSKLDYSQYYVDSGSYGYQENYSGASTATRYIDVSSNGTHTVYVKVWDKATNHNSGSATIKVDALAPSCTTPTLPTADGSNGWFKTKPTITLAGTDGESLVAHILTSYDGLGYVSRSVSSPNYSYDFSSWTEGSHTLTFEAEDNVGHFSTQSAPITIKLDTDVPSKPSLTAPINGITLHDQTPTFMWDNGVKQVDDGSTISYKIQVAKDDNPTFSAPLEIDATTTEATFTPTSLLDARTDAYYIWRVKAVDEAGWESDWTITTTNTCKFKIDKNPTTTIIKGTGWNKDRITITNYGTGNNGVLFSGEKSSETTKIEFTITDGTNSVSHNLEGLPLNTDSYAMTGTGINCSTLNDGNIGVKIIAKGSAGNEIGRAENTVAEAIFKKDVVLPTGSITFPVNEGFVKGQVQLSGTTFDTLPGQVSKYVLCIKAQSEASWATREADFVSKKLDTTVLSDGNYNLSLDVFDEAGNVAEKTGQMITVTVDNTSPEASISPITSPATGTVTISGSATDTPATNFEKYEIYRENAGGGSATKLSEGTSSGAISYSWDTTSGPDGAYKVYVKGYDKAGNINTSSKVDVTVDNHAPNAPTNVSASPKINNTGTFTITWTAPSDISGIASYNVYKTNLSNGETALLTPTAPPLSETNLDQGKYSYQIAAIDGLGHESTKSGAVEVIVDKTNPNAAPLLEPAAGGWSGITPTFKWGMPTDPETVPGCSSKIAGFVLTVDNVPVNDAAHLITTTSKKLKDPLNENNHTWSITAFDCAGNYTTSEANFRIDVTAPSTFNLVGPLDKDWSGNPAFTWEASSDGSGSGIGYYIIHIDGKNVNVHITATSEAISTSYAPVEPLLKGTYTWYVEAVDNADKKSRSIKNASNEEWTVTVNPTGPEMDVTIDGKSVSDGSIVSSDSTIKAVISNINGVDTGSIVVKVDDTVVDRGNLTIASVGKGILADGSYPGKCEVTYKVKLEEGSGELQGGKSHNIEISVADPMGKESIWSVSSLQVYSDLFVTNFKIYPNPYKPSKGTLKVKYTLSKDVDVKIYVMDVTGRVIWQKFCPAGSLGGYTDNNDIEWDGMSGFGSSTSAEFGGSKLGDVAGNGVYLIFVASNGKVLKKGQVAIYE